MWDCTGCRPDPIRFVMVMRLIPITETGYLGRSCLQPPARRYSVVVGFWPLRLSGARCSDTATVVSASLTGLAAYFVVVRVLSSRRLPPSARVGTSGAATEGRAPSSRGLPAPEVLFAPRSTSLTRTTARSGRLAPTWRDALVLYYDIQTGTAHKGRIPRPPVLDTGTQALSWRIMVASTELISAPAVTPRRRNLSVPWPNAVARRRGELASPQ